MSWSSPLNGAGGLGARSRGRGHQAKQQGRGMIQRARVAAATSPRSTSPTSISPTGSVAAVHAASTVKIRETSPTNAANTAASTASPSSSPLAISVAAGPTSAAFPASVSNTSPTPASPKGNARTTVQALSLTLIGLNGIQKQQRMADFTIQDDLKALKSQINGDHSQVNGSWAALDADTAPENHGSNQQLSPNKPLTPMGKIAAEQRDKLDSMLTESASMTADIDALLRRISSVGALVAPSTKFQRKRLPIGSGTGHRRQLSRSLPDLRSAIGAEVSRARRNSRYKQSPLIDSEYVALGTGPRSKGGAGAHTAAGPSSVVRSRIYPSASNKVKAIAGGPQGRSGRKSLARASEDFMHSLRSTRNSSQTKVGNAGKCGEDSCVCFGAYSLAGADNSLDDAQNRRQSGRKLSPKKKGKSTKTNQDRVLMVDNFPERGAAVFAVFDGHGPQGERCAQLCADEFVGALKKAHFDEKVTACSTGAALTISVLSPVIQRAFTFLQRALHHASFDSTSSGTTATACIVLPRLHKLVTMNCGDSNLCVGSLFTETTTGQAQAGRLHADSTGMGVPSDDASHHRQRSISDGGDRSGGPSREQQHQTQQLQHQEQSNGGPKSLVLPKFRIKFAFKEHVPTNPKERARIEAAGGFVHRLAGDVDRVWATHPDPGAGHSSDELGEWSDDGGYSDGDDDNSDGMDGSGLGHFHPEYHAGGGLAMSRSLGDEDLHACGVSAVPAVRVHDIQSPRDQFVVLASDGVWDHANEFDIVDIIGAAQQDHTAVQGSWNADEPARLLCELARKRWTEQHGRVDDISAIVVNLSSFLSPGP